MKVLVLADVHSNVDMLNRVLDSVTEEYELIVCVGDITDFGPVSIAEEVIAGLKNIGCFVFVVSGNCDPPEVGGSLVNNGISLEGRRIPFDEYVFYGVGGGTGGAYAITEEDIDRVLRGVAVDGGILVSHMPPKGGCDKKIGSESVRRIVDEFKPKFVFCGHAHEGRGKCELGESVVVNPGPVRDGYYAIVDLETKEVVLEVVKNEAGKTDKK